MAATYQYSPRSKLNHAATTPSPLRHASTASSNSSNYSRFSHPFPPSRSSTISSTDSDPFRPACHKRGLSEAAVSFLSSAGSNMDATSLDSGRQYKAARESLRPLPQAPASSPPPADKTRTSPHSRSQSVDYATSPPPPPQHDGSTSPTSKAARPNSLMMTRSDSVRGARDKDHAARRRHAQGNSSQSHVLDKPDLQTFQRAATGHLRTLSKFASDASEDDFTIRSPDQEVAGLHGRRRLQRTDSARGRTAGYGGRTWMDQQRQFLQAYEYLCHIGEAKEWIEDVIGKDIPPIVQLEEGLRDGVTLAEIVQALHPEKQFRIFRSPKLQFRHSDNIALFFRFLAEVELPELFRFELVDLYEKKNIPKVIYCIHALSWLLFRQGRLDFRIGNLVGQLQFEDHELEATQKGLDKAGVSMPNFSGMSANFIEEPEPEPEPVETEEERIERELIEREPVIVDLQAQARGALLRAELGALMQHLWSSEGAIVELQSRLRGEWTRQIFQYRLGMNRSATSLQSAIRGYLVRSRKRGEEEYWRDKKQQVVLVQNLVRGRKARTAVQHIKSQIQCHEHGIRQLQAAIRGALRRTEIGEQYYAVRDSEVGVATLQAAIRGMLLRKALDDDMEALHRQKPAVVSLQAMVRGHLLRLQQARSQQLLEQAGDRTVSLQSVIRGSSLRESLRVLRQRLRSEAPRIARLQASARGSSCRKEVEAIRAAVAAHETSIVSLQGLVRGLLLRRKRTAFLDDVSSHTPQIVAFQSAVRASLLRQKVYDTLCHLNDHQKQISDLQSSVRGMLERSRVDAVLSHLDAHEDSVTQLQTLARGMLVRSRYGEKKKYFDENMQKVVKIQSFIRARQQGEAYKSLTSGENPPVGTIKNFVHLLNDSDFDFEEEIESERLRKTVIQHVRQNEMAEQYIDQLDIKIALLVKNKITLDEVVKHQKHFGGHVGNLLTNKEISSKDPFDLKALNKNSRKKLEHYQELFFILQTQPQYLARLFKKIREQATAEKECKRIELLMMGLFGFAQKRREEYYLLKLIGRSIKEEIDGCSSLQEYLRGNFFWNKLFSSYIRSPRDRKFLRDLLGPLIRENIIENENLDLESDPMQIYRSAINNEELRTGRRSARDPNIPREDAIKDPETKYTFIAHLQDLRDIADQFLITFEEILHRMPFGTRFVAQQTFELLRAKFPHEDVRHLLHLVGQWVWKSYFQPALTQPEQWGVVDRGLSPMQRRNLGEVAKVLGQVSAARLFGGENLYLLPMNNYVSDAIVRLGDIWSSLVDVRDAESHFDIDEFNDLYARTKPTLYIKLADIFAIHQLVAQDVSYLCPSQDDVLREVVRELGSAKTNENEMMGVSSTEISLTLNAKLHDVEDPDAVVKALFMETKRCVLYMIRVQTGGNLMEVMIKPITDDDEDKWDALVREELAAQNAPEAHRKTRGAYAADASSTLSDLTSLTYADLKRTCLGNILELERRGRVTRHDHYQALLNAIALDIRTQHRRRLQRARECDAARATLAALDAKARWLDQQLRSYNDYVEQAMVTLQSKKGKRRFLLPFTRQYNHERELARSGRTPRFGSYKYSARQLADKGVLVHWQGYYHPAEGGAAGAGQVAEKLSITISSDEVGVFHIEGSAGSMMIPGASAAVPLDDLLQAQFNNCQFLNLFGTGPNGGATGEGAHGGGGDGPLRLNVNLLVHLVMKKFYREE